jgi:hypothetical protein
MTNHSRTDHHVGELLSGYIDGELTQQDRQRVSIHCEDCEQCAALLAELEALRARMGTARIGKANEDIWRELIDDPAVTTTRGIGWLLLIGGLLLAAGFAIYEFVREIESIPTIALLIIGGLYGGILLLFYAVLRQRLIERKTDKYEDVEI